MAFFERREPSDFRPGGPDENARSQEAEALGLPAQDLVDLLWTEEERVEAELDTCPPTDDFMELVTAAPSERRTAARIQRVLVAGLLEPSPTPIVIIDLSLTGLRIGSVEPLEQGLTLRIQLPLQPEPLELSGRVRWCKAHASGNFEVGLHLVPLAGDQLVRYRQFLGLPD